MLFMLIPSPQRDHKRGEIVARGMVVGDNESTGPHKLISRSSVPDAPVVLAQNRVLDV